MNSALDPIAERELHLSGGGAPVVIRLGRPRPDPAPEGDWICPFEISGLDDGDRSLRAAGVDSFQALLLALRMIEAELRYSLVGAQLTWHEGVAPGPFCG